MKASAWCSLLCPVLCSALLGSGCATPMRFLDRPVVWKVDDTRDLAQEPRENVYRKQIYFAEIFLLRRSTRALELGASKPAMNTNALDEVPNSTWFTNRIGRRAMTPEEVAAGPGGAPEPPFVVTAGKVGGGNPGFIVQDRAGKRFLMKFDAKENPEMQTATDVIVARLFWSAGYHTPADHVVHFRRDEISLDPEAKVSETLGGKRRMVEADVENVLATAPPLADGSIRAIVSGLLPGKPIGGFDPEGVRDDDKNDTIPHEHRRELRGLLPLAAWVNHTDMKQDNTLDMYIEEDGRRFVRHYFVDFGEAFAAHAAEKGRKEDGYEHLWDWSAQPRALLSFGLWKRPWEDLEDTPWPAIGAFDAEHFDPQLYKPAYPWWPFFEVDAADRYWGAKLVMAFDRPMLEAVVAEAKLSDPEAAKYLVEVLLARRDKIGKAYLEAVTALDEFQVKARSICAVDLGVRYGIATAGAIDVLDEEGAVLRTSTVDRGGGVCFALDGGPGYHLYRLRARRGRELRPVMQLHVIGDGAEARIVGLVRVEANN